VLKFYNQEKETALLQTVFSKILAFYFFAAKKNEMLLCEKFARKVEHFKEKTLRSYDIEQVCWSLEYM
jgi:hypothetical protein